MKTRLLVVPGLALTIWLAGILFTTDLAVPVRDVRRFKNVLVVFPHADDETVNCGGAIRRFSSAGATVTLLLLTGGERGNPEGTPDASLKAIRRREAEEVAGILGVSRLIQEDFGDGQLRDRREQVTAYLSREIARINPDLILTHDLAGLDGHEDHVACSEILTELKRKELPQRVSLVRGPASQGPAAAHAGRTAGHRCEPRCEAGYPHAQAVHWL